MFLDNGQGRAEVFGDTDTAIGALIRDDAGLIIAFDDGPFGTFINAAPAIDAILGNPVNDDSRLWIFISSGVAWFNAILAAGLALLAFPCPSGRKIPVYLYLLQGIISYRIFPSTWVRSDTGP